MISRPGEEKYYFTKLLKIMAINLLNNNDIKKNYRYKIGEIKPKHFIQVELKKGVPAWSKGAEIEVLRVDPSNSGRILGKLACYGFLSREKGEYKEVLLHVDQICRNYTLDPIIPTLTSYKGGKHNTDAIEFEAKRKPKR